MRVLTLLRFFTSLACLVSLCFLLYDIYDNWSLYQTAYYMRPQNARRIQKQPVKEDVAVIMCYTQRPEERIRELRHVVRDRPLYIFTTKSYTPPTSDKTVTCRVLSDPPHSLWELVLEVPAHRVFFVSEGSVLLEDPFLHLPAEGSVFWPRPQVSSLNGGGGGGIASFPATLNLHAFLFDRSTHREALEAVLWCLRNTPATILSDNQLAEIIAPKIQALVPSWSLVPPHYQILHSKRTWDSPPLVLSPMDSDVSEDWCLSEQPQKSTTFAWNPKEAFVVQGIKDLKTEDNVSHQLVWSKDAWHLVIPEDKAHDWQLCERHIKRVS